MSRSLSANAPSFDLANTGQSFGLQTSDFTLTSSGGSFSVGGLYTVNFPENSVCDPDNSSYGPSEWDKACATLRSGQAIKIHAVLSLQSGGLAIDFSPSLRFSPAAQVTISTDIFASVIKWNQDYFGKHPEALNALAIYYAPSLDAFPVKDFGGDATVGTHVNLTTGRIWRRIKHFSGYNILAGMACDPSPNDPNCVEVDSH
ncbi:MAG: hypothetical protein ABJF01_14485 [bacterium]